MLVAEGSSKYNVRRLTLSISCVSIWGGYDRNGRSQMQGGKNWILLKEIKANRVFWDSHWLEIWKRHFCPSMGPNGGSVAMDSAGWVTHLHLLASLKFSLWVHFFASFFLVIISILQHRKVETKGTLCSASIFLWRRCKDLGLFNTAAFFYIFFLSFVFLLYCLRLLSWINILMITFESTHLV